MAEDDSRDIPHTSASTPNSTAGNDGALKAAKDRNCPFCGQAFTSSSLGRHLDLYIKPKNPKPPDGVHDVDEIRKIRGGITRRQPRTSNKPTEGEDEERRNSSGWSSQPASKKQKTGSKVTDRSPVDSPTTAKDGQSGLFMNAPGWEATGVINDLPARASSRNQNSSTPTGSGQAQRLQEMRRDAAGNRIERPDYETMEFWKLQESAEVGRAAEMALREVLGSFEAAKKKVNPSRIYEDFDFCTLSFPGLCLAILPPPPGLFSTTPFTAAHTWSLAPPGENQFDSLTRYLKERINQIRKHNDNSISDSTAFGHLVHLEGAYEHWKSMSEADKLASWSLEVSRAFIREKEKREQLRSDLDTAEQRIRQLEAEYDRLSRCQLPREYMLHPPQTVPVSSAVMREMKFSELKSGAYEVGLDAEQLIGKWTKTVKATTRAQKPPSKEPFQYVEKSRNQMKADMMMNGTMFGVNGPMPRDTNTDETKHPYDAIRYEYETPRVPGTIIDEGGGDGDVDAEGEAEDNPDWCPGSNIGALMRLRSSNPNGGESPNDTFNANGKRSLGAGGGSGRPPGPKVYKESH